MKTLHHLSGTLRASSPEKTLAILEPQLFKRFGITRLADITGLDNIGLPVVTAIRPNSKCLAVSQGKGYTLTLAKVSALMESIETWHAENIPEHCTALRGSFSQLHNDYPLANLDSFTRRNPEEVVENTTFSWVKTQDLLNNTLCYLPRALFSLDTTTMDERHFIVSSNGLASGNTRDEAICHSLCELIERDAVARWLAIESEAEQDKTLLDLSSISTPFLRELLDKIQTAELVLQVWDITTSNGIPAFYATLCDVKRVPITLFSGSGAHVDAHIALSRAITETAQARLTYISGNRDDIFPDFYRDFDPSEVALELAKLQGTYAFTPCAMPAWKTFTEINTFLCDTLRQYGITQLFLFEHTRADIGIAVVHILAPELWYSHE